MIDELLQYLHLNSVTSDDTYDTYEAYEAYDTYEAYKSIVCCLTNEIIKLKLELSEYKAFHDAILENEAIKCKFREYELKIDELQNKINNTRK